MNRLPRKSKTSFEDIDRAPRAPAGDERSALSLRIDAVLPQTQCTRCGYPACLPYAQAIAAEDAPINQCPPGGDEGIRKLAALTQQPYQKLNPANGIEGPRRLAQIDEARCIGCALCLAACPVDAIVGGLQRMHTVIAAECTGCELCIAPCPVDCIEMALPEPALPDWSKEDAQHARQRFIARNDRIARKAQLTQAEQSKSKLQAMLEKAKAKGLHRAKSRV